jgi:hypothetical protein
LIVKHKKESFLTYFSSKNIALDVTARGGGAVPANKKGRMKRPLLTTKNGRD